ncbi:MAG: phage head closure protein, partial [Proteobacteria bacterium]|nr:phage head closure protein [Pseudomonadota bacterium]
ADVWADVRYLSGIEAMKSEFPVSIARASIRIRWRSDVDATCRVVFGSVVFGVKAVLIDSNNQYLDLVCETGANNG